MADEHQMALLREAISRSKRVKFASGVPVEIVADAEHHLGLKFPPSYRWWLLHYGAGYLNGCELQGLYPQKVAERDPRRALSGDIIDLAHRNASSAHYPAHLLEFLSYEKDQAYFFDTQQGSPNGEWPVVRIGNGSGQPEQVAGSFAEFLEKQLT